MLHLITDTLQWQQKLLCIRATFWRIREEPRELKKKKEARHFIWEESVCKKTFHIYVIEKAVRFKSYDEVSSMVWAKAWHQTFSPRSTETLFKCMLMRASIPIYILPSPHLRFFCLHADTHRFKTALSTPQNQAEGQNNNKILINLHQQEVHSQARFQPSISPRLCATRYFFFRVVLFLSIKT